MYDPSRLESEEARERESFFADPPCLLLAHRISPSRSIRLAVDGISMEQRLG
ncbi:unnamed protein product [Arabidopsis thaliana]|uniref:(thale cress) hypothetical protein n=1 Tax=Arabidopsis thaliana TaxID=3702 RepID=A0A7G2DYA9_ARATH|nr:unnamed protein product [Arabidopsis thaliana]